MIGAEDKPKPKPLSLTQDYQAQTDSGTSVDTSSGYTPGMVWGPRLPGTEPAPFRGSADASDRWARDWSNSQSNTWMSGTDADASFGSLPEWQQKMFNDLAAGSPAWNDTGESVYRKYVDASAAASKQGKRLTPAELALADLQGTQPDPQSGPDGSRRRGPGGGPTGTGGPQTSVSYQNADAFSVRDIADQVSMEMLGRGVTQQEMERILKRVRKYEARNPSVTTGQATPGGSVSQSKGGVSSAGYQEVIERMIAKNPEFGDYQSATTVMGWFDDWLAKRGQAVG